MLSPGVTFLARVVQGVRLGASVFILSYGAALHPNGHSIRPVGPASGGFTISLRMGLPGNDAGRIRETEGP